MIFDKIENHKNYRGINKGIDAAFDYLLTTDLDSLETGKHLFEDERIFAVCMKYETKDESLAKNEAHKKYIDIQYIVSGAEKMIVSGLEGLEIIEEYDEETDVMFFENKNDCEFIAKSGHFAVFFPEDGHAPTLNIDGKTSSNKKIVVKIPV